MKVNLQHLEHCFDALNVLVLGDVILDHYLIGKVDRISPEAPVPVVLHEKEDYRLGGAANVALNIKALGATPHLFSMIGDDNYGKQFLALLDKEGIDARHVFVDSNRQTTCKTRILARNQHLLRYDQESTANISSELETQVLKEIEGVLALKKIDAIVFQDYNKGLLTSNIIQSVLRLAQSYHIPTLADPKKTNFLTYRGVDYFKPNLREINEGLSLSIPDKNPTEFLLKAAAQEINGLLSNKCTIITLGAKGIFYALGSTAFLVPTQERQIADVCGAGDTVISVLSLGVAAKLDFSQIVTLANIGGGQVCEQVGVVSVNKDALLKEYNLTVL